MRVIFRASEDFLSRVRQDLARPHSFADERVGFIAVRATLADEQLVLLAQRYYPVADDGYVHDASFGALVGQEAFRRILEIALLEPVGIFHVHEHQFPGRAGRLWFSGIDLAEQLKFVPDFFKVRPAMPHGAIVLGPDSAAGRVWRSAKGIQRIAEFNTIGERIRVSFSADDGTSNFYS